MTQQSVPARLALACASHTPLMDRIDCPEEVEVSVNGAFAKLAEDIRAFDPELIIQFSPDHFNGFFYELMPAFCIGIEAESVGDWQTSPGVLGVPQDVAEELAATLLEERFDIATSRRMQVDHGVVQIWEKMFGSASNFPIIPIFVNSAAPPSPTMRRARELGHAVGQFALGTGKRVLIVASGGLSHDPPIPRLATATPEVRDQLIDRNPSVPRTREEREQRVLEAGRLAKAGAPGILPVSEEWDCSFLEKLRFGPDDAFDDATFDEIVREGGRGAPEVLCWVAAMAALRAGGPVVTKLHCYHAVQGWIAGMAVLTGRNK